MPDEPTITEGSAGRSRRRVARKRNEIEFALRRDIVAGVYGPGARLPPRVELERRFGASPVTVQRALDLLSDAGFVEARARQGTRVSDHPPHLSCYGLAFPEWPGRPGWNRFYSAVCDEASRIERTEPVSFRIYHGLAQENAGPQQAALLSDMRRDLLAGVIFAFYPGFLDGTPLLTHPGVPRVVVLREQTWPGLSSMVFDSKGLIDKALDFFAARGRRRVAILSLAWFAETYESYILAALESRGLITRSYWIQVGPHPLARWVRACAHLLMSEHQSERPDALLITDDNLIEPATAGLVAAGVRSPRDLEIVGHCNFPSPAPSHLPITRVGYDIRRFVRQGMDCIDRQRHGERRVMVTENPAVWEHEVI